MKNDRNKNSEPTPEKIKKAGRDYNPTNRDFQRTEKDIDNISKSEKDEIGRRNEIKK